MVSCSDAQLEATVYGSVYAGGFASVYVTHEVINYALTRPTPYYRVKSGFMSKKTMLVLAALSPLALCTMRGQDGIFGHSKWSDRRIKVELASSVLAPAAAITVTAAVVVSTM